MGVLKGRNSSNNAWANASVVYGWNSSGVKTYAKAFFIRKADNTWDRSWTDCRLYDAAGGRDWSAPTTVVTYSGTCGNRTETTTVTRTKTGCPNDVRATTVSSPNCVSDCFNITTSTVYSGTCNSRTSATRTTYTAKSGSNCTSYFTDSTYVSDPNCTGCTGTPYVSNSCSGCGSITTTPGTGGCPDTTSGSCGTWEQTSDPLGVYGVVTLSVGSYPYAVYSFASGKWFYSDAAGNLCNCGCPGGTVIAPGYVEICSQGGFRAGGADRCTT